jgi:uncharacterized membrane protein YdjX (TVP38/TMEM64 family)
MKNNFETYGLVGLLAGISGILFVSAWFAHRYEVVITSYVTGHSLMSYAVFVVIAFIAVVIPIWSNLFLIPFGVVAWGPVLTTVLCVTGWWVGAVFSFALGRIFQASILRKYPLLYRYADIDAIIPSRHVFIGLVVLRMTFPVDVLSYALGIFSKKVTHTMNAVSTLVGIIPFALLFAYFSEVSRMYQVGIISITVGSFAAYYVYVYFYNKKNRSEKV